MMTEEEWRNIAERVFPKRPVKAPPFLWTRVLAGIATEERRRESTWWLQWRTMSRITAVVGLLASVGTYWLFQQATLPLDAALDGRSTQHQALQIASAEMPSADEAAVLVLGFDS